MTKLPQIHQHQPHQPACNSPLYRQAQSHPSPSNLLSLQRAHPSPTIDQPMQSTKNRFTSKTHNNFTLSSNKLQYHFKPKSQQLQNRLTSRLQPLTPSKTSNLTYHHSTATNSNSTSIQSQNNVTITSIQRQRPQCLRLFTW